MKIEDKVEKDKKNYINSSVFRQKKGLRAQKKNNNIFQLTEIRKKQSEKQNEM